MRLIFLGNGPFACPALERLAGSEHTVALVVTRPDRPQGKHQEILAGPVKSLAQARGLPVVQPADVNEAGFITSLAAHGADLLVVADFGQILSRACLGAARLGGINIHASLLPKYRGAAPVAWAIVQGEIETGISIIRMIASLDAGDVLVQKRHPIASNQTAGELEAELAILGSTAAIEAVDALAAGAVVALPQDPAAATRAPKLKKSDGAIRWNQTPRQVCDHIRGMQPWPVAYTHWMGPKGPIRLQILSARPVPAPTSDVAVSPGEVISVDATHLIVACCRGAVSIERIQPAGKTAMDIASFLRGHRPRPGDIFE